MNLIELLILSWSKHGGLPTFQENKLYTYWSEWRLPVKYEKLLIQDVTGGAFISISKPNFSSFFEIDLSQQSAMIMCLVEAAVALEARILLWMV